MEEENVPWVLGLLPIVLLLVSILTKKNRKQIFSEMKSDLNVGVKTTEKIVEQEIKADIEIVREDFVDPIRHLPAMTANVIHKITHHDKPEIVYSYIDAVDGKETDQGEDLRQSISTI